MVLRKDRPGWRELWPTVCLTENELTEFLKTTHDKHRVSCSVLDTLPTPPFIFVRIYLRIAELPTSRYYTFVLHLIEVTYVERTVVQKENCGHPRSIY